jgi:Flp pilus assembly protein TadD
MGLIEEARAQRLSQPAKNDKLREAAKWLERALELRAKSGSDDYTIYNTLGYVYLQYQDIINAERVLTQGLKLEARLSTSSRAKLHNNLGYLYALKGDKARSIQHYNMAGSMRNSSVAVSAQANSAKLSRVK